MIISYSILLQVYAEFFIAVFVFLMQPKATLRFPLGQVSLEETEEEEEDAQRKLSLNGIFSGPLLDGICTARYRDENLNLRYSYKVSFCYQSLHFCFFFNFYQFYEFQDD